MMPRWTLELGIFTDAKSGCSKTNEQVATSFAWRKGLRFDAQRRFQEGTNGELSKVC